MKLEVRQLLRVRRKNSSPSKIKIFKIFIFSIAPESGYYYLRHPEQLLSFVYLYLYYNYSSLSLVYLYWYYNYSWYLYW